MHGRTGWIFFFASLGVVLLAGFWRGADLFPSWSARPVEGHYRSVDFWHVRGSDSRGKSLLASRIVGSRFVESDFSGADWSGSTILRSRFQDVSFAGARWRDVTARATRFHRVDFRGADLQGAVFLSCDFQGSLFDGATRLPFSKERAAQLGMREAVP
ncbi:MAG: pentapeptide repeat-containing protein [Bdellovibrionaceae bacterium]|nr:pentapeptide repeat-containing protein [Pseudobdellovibrionaceae bacterium]